MFSSSETIDRLNQTNQLGKLSLEMVFTDASARPSIVGYNCSGGVFMIFSDSQNRGYGLAMNTGWWLLTADSCKRTIRNILDDHGISYSSHVDDLTYITAISEMFAVDYALRWIKQNKDYIIIENDVHIVTDAKAIVVSCQNSGSPYYCPRDSDLRQFIALESNIHSYDYDFIITYEHIRAHQYDDYSIIDVLDMDLKAFGNRVADNVADIRKDFQMNIWDYNFPKRNRHKYCEYSSNPRPYWSI